MLSLLQRRTVQLIRYDLQRARTRWRQGRRRTPAAPKLHFGCGTRKVRGWLNCDLEGSDWNVDLACGRLPWVDSSFEQAVSQHVIEHLEMSRELAPLLAELHRVLRPGGELWLSTPDLEKICRYYLEDRGAGLVTDRQLRFPDFSLRGAPTQQIINHLFHQGGEHRNLFDFELLRHLLERAGFTNVRRTSEPEFLASHPEFPRREDDYQSLYVTALKAEGGAGGASRFSARAA